MKREKAYAIIKAIKELRSTIADEVALKFIDLYPNWESGVELSIGDRVEYGGKLYKVIQSHTAQSTWTPDVALTLFEPIDITHSGTKDNPITATVGMTYIKDLYYFDESDGNVYRCIRADSDNGTTLYHLPNALVGLYFEVCEQIEAEPR